MFKKMLTVLLAAMLLCAAASCAAQSETIHLADLGEGYEAVLVMDNPVTLTSFEDVMPTGFVYVIASREGVADVDIVVTKSDEAEGLSLADLGEKGMAILCELLGEQYVNPIYEEKTTPSGNLYLQICSNEEESEVDSMLTLFEGYLIEMDVYREDFSKLSEADKAFAEELFFALWFRKTNE